MKAAGDYFGVDLLCHSELVEQQPKLAWGIAFWHWMTNRVSPYTPAMTPSPRATALRRPFEPSMTRMECDDKMIDSMSSRIDFYRQFCKILGCGIGPGPLRAYRA